VLRDATRGIYKRVIVKDDKILGAVLYGDTADGNWYFDLLKKGRGHFRHPRCADLRAGIRRRGRHRKPY
jgi:NAD(P)H-nitrite reductase large subunit